MSRQRYGVRWNDVTERLVQAAAEACSVSKAQFIREAVLIRAILVLDEMPGDGRIDVARLRDISRRVRGLADDLD